MLAAVLGVAALVLAAIGSTKVHLDPRLLEYSTGFVIPLVVGFITKLHASKGLKAALNFLLSAIAGGLAVALTTHGDVVLSTWIAGIAQTFVVSIATYYGLWKPTGVAASVQTSTAELGVGANAPPPPPPPPPPQRDDILPVRPVVASPAPAKRRAPAKRATKKR